MPPWYQHWCGTGWRYAGISTSSPHTQEVFSRNSSCCATHQARENGRLVPLASALRFHVNTCAQPGSTNRYETTVGEYGTDFRIRACARPRRILCSYQPLKMFEVAHWTTSTGLPQLIHLAYARITACQAAAAQSHHQI